MELIRFICKFLPISILCCTSLVFAQKSYIPDEALRNTIRKELWQELKLETPKKQRFLTGLSLSSNECFKLYEKAAKQRNWKPYELVTIASFYKIILEETVAGKDYREDEIKAVYQSIGNQYELINLTGQVTNDQIQNAYDKLILKALWIGTVFELSKKNSLEIQKKAEELLVDFNIETLISPKRNLTEKDITEVENEGTESAVNGSRPILTNNSNLNEVEDVIIRTVTSYGLGGAYVKNEVSILFKSGDIMTNPSVPINALNIARSKRSDPKKWGTWEKKGNILWVTKLWKNKTYDWKKWFQLRPSNKNIILKGRFKSSDGFGGSKVINANNVSFDGKGRFAWKNIKGGNTVWKPVYSKSNTAGTYTIDEYTLTLNYNDGASESFFFGFYPKDNLHFVIGSNHFTPIKD